MARKYSILRNSGSVGPERAHDHTVKLAVGQEVRQKKRPKFSFIIVSKTGGQRKKRKHALSVNAASRRSRKAVNASACRNREGEEFVALQYCRSVIVQNGF